MKPRSPRNGEHRRTTDAPASIALPCRAANSCSQRPVIASRPRLSSRASSRSGRRICHEIPEKVSSAVEELCYPAARRSTAAGRDGGASGTADGGESLRRYDARGGAPSGSAEIWRGAGGNGKLSRGTGAAVDGE